MNMLDLYRPMDRILQEINQNFIALPPEEVADNNSVLNEILTAIIDGMKEKSPLFEQLFNKPFYGGSYWDGVKVSRPDEYDIHVQMSGLPYHKKLEPSNEPGWINLKFDKIGKQLRGRHYKPYYGIDGLHVLINSEGFLDTEKVMLWFHQTLSMTLGGIKRNKKRHANLLTTHGNFKLSFRRHGPAFTFCIKGLVNGSEVDVHLDFVPCFVFVKDQYPVNGFEPNLTSKGETFIVAKPVKRKIGNRYWRLSFQKQERELMKDKLHFKPALRLLKKMRDRLQHACIASYFIKNLMLLELNKRSDDFWKNPLSYVFMEVLKDYQEAIERGVLKFYWYKLDNLIGHIEKANLKKISTELSHAISFMEKSPGNLRIARYFLTRKENGRFKKIYGRSDGN